MERSRSQPIIGIRVRFEVEVIRRTAGFTGDGVAYSSVTVTGRTEKEALGLLVQAMEKYMKEEARKTSSGS
jgi:hypothetical protein